jgi:hypothetical protein
MFNTVLPFSKVTSYTHSFHYIIPLDGRYILILIWQKLDFVSVALRNLTNEVKII